MISHSNFNMPYTNLRRNITDSNGCTMYLTGNCNVTDNVFMTILVPRMKTDDVNFRKKRIFQCMNKVISANSDVSNHTSLDTFLTLWKSL
jgi:hypothetical protein